MPKAKPAHHDQDEARRRAEAQRSVDEHLRNRDSAWRPIFTTLRLWMACPGKRCMRARACRGDTTRCLRERWRPLVPAELKATIGKMLEYQRDGLSARDAMARANADMAHHREAMARVEAMQAAPPPMPPRAPRRQAPPPAFAGPRIRSV